MAQRIFPADPDCPEVHELYMAFLDEKETGFDGHSVEELMQRWEEKHVTTCKRCKRYGTHNTIVGC